MLKSIADSWRVTELDVLMWFVAMAYGIRELVDHGDTPSFLIIMLLAYIISTPKK